MFCTSLRRRASFASVLHALSSSSSGPSLRENQLATHDIAIPLKDAGEDPRRRAAVVCRQLRLLLLSPSSVSEKRLAATIDRIQNLACLTAGQDIAIVFSLAPPRDTGFRSARHATQADSIVEDQELTVGMCAYAKLQAELMNRADLPSIRIFPLAKLDGLPGFLPKIEKALSNNSAPRCPPLTAPTELLALCTANAQMKQQTVFVLSDLFPTLANLARVCTSPTPLSESSPPLARDMGAFHPTQMAAQGVEPLSTSSQASSSAYHSLKQLRNLVGDKERDGVVLFWKGEFAVD